MARGQARPICLGNDVGVGSPARPEEVDRGVARRPREGGSGVRPRAFARIRTRLGAFYGRAVCVPGTVHIDTTLVSCSGATPVAQWYSIGTALVSCGIALVLQLDCTLAFALVLHLCCIGAALALHCHDPGFAMKLRSSYTFLHWYFDGPALEIMALN